MSNSSEFQLSQEATYGQNFLNSWAGSIIEQPLIAIVELIANAWDAYSTEVSINLPDATNNKKFSIRDNGMGLTQEEFSRIWRQLSFDRISAWGDIVSAPSYLTELPPRVVFGKNGKGRFANFCFSDAYRVESYKDGIGFSCVVMRCNDKPFKFDEFKKLLDKKGKHGVFIESCGEIYQRIIDEQNAREHIGSRFLSDPNFSVKVNNQLVCFTDLSKDAFQEKEIDVPNYGKVILYCIDSKKSDKHTKQHGIAWWVLGRAVGSCGWHGTDRSKILDGRTQEAKRYTFIINADFLHKHHAVKADWTWFIEGNDAWKATEDIIQREIKQIISDIGRDERDETKKSIKKKISHKLENLTPLSRASVENFVDAVVDDCPSMRGTDIEAVSSILAKLEGSSAKYGLLHILETYSSSQMDKLHDMLETWTLDMAKLVLDEIETRLKILNELKAKVEIKGIDEVHELQPVFDQGLWMLGPAFESIEFTSNVGMTKVMQNLFGKKDKGSRSRPDFVVKFIPNYDRDFNEKGVARLVIVDLKTTGIKIGEAEKNQVWGYVKELLEKNIIQPETEVKCFILGDLIASYEGEAEKKGKNTEIIPLLYSDVINRAEQRLFKLSDRVKDAPFMADHKEDLDIFLNPENYEINHQSNLNLV